MKKESLKRLVPWLKGLLFLGILAFVTFKIWERQDEFLELGPMIQSRIHVPGLLFLLALVPVNWGLETFKWRWLVHFHIPLSWPQAWRGVLTGLAMGFITPHAIGDYFGRIVTVKEGDPWTLGGLVMVSRAAQMIATSFFGCWGLARFYDVPVYLCLGGMIICAIILAGIIVLLKRDWANDKVTRFLWVFRTLHWKQWSVVIGLAMMRYLVFAFQLAFAMHMLGDVEISLAFAGTTWIFLAKSLAPAFNFLSDLGIREASAILFFEPLGIELLPILAATLFIWVINILLPTLAGAALLWGGENILTNGKD